MSDQGTTPMPNKPLTLDQLKQFKDKSRKARRNFERDWALNMAYVAGEQHVRYDSTTNRIYKRPSVDTDLRTVHNIMLKIHRMEKAKLIKTKPVPAVLPASENQKDLLTARVSSAYCRQLVDDWKFETKHRVACAWVSLTGNAFFKWYWAGGNQCSVVSPFDLYPDPYARSLSDARWVIHSKFMDCAEAKMLYGKYKDSNMAAIVNTEMSPMTELESTVFTSLGFGSDKLEGVVVNEYFEPPSPYNEVGRYVVFTEEGIIFQTKYPYAHKKLPFTHFTHITRPNTIWADEVMSTLRPMQDELNRSETQIIKNRALSQGKYFYPMGLETNEEPDAEPGQILKAVAGAPNQVPVNLAVNTLQGWVQGEPDRYRMSMQDIAGQHEVSNGGVPGRVEAATAIQLLQEQDDNVLRETFDSMEEALADGFMISLELYKQFGTVLDIQVYDKDGMFEKRQLKADMLPIKSRVRVQTQSGLPQSVAGRWDRVMLLTQQGLVTPQSALEMLDLGGEQLDLIPAAQDRKNAWRENYRMQEGEVIRARKWEDHDAHILEHKKFMKSPEFDELSRVDQGKFEFHLEEHENWNAVVKNEEATIQAIMQGAAIGQQLPEPGSQQGPPVNPQIPPAMDPQQGGATMDSTTGSPVPVQSL